MPPINSTRGRAVLMLGHIAGMVDMVALPLWVGALIQHYRYSPQQAGLTVTAFLLVVAGTSAILSPLFNRLPRRAVGGLGFALAAASFYVAASRPVGEEGFATLMLLHALGGIGIGCGLSMAQGAIGRAANPHRMFAWAQSLLGAFAVLFLGGMPQVIAARGGSMVFAAFAVVMALAAVALLAAYPVLDEPARPSGASASSAAPGRPPALPIPGAAWFAMLTVVCLTLNNAMVFSFVERVGAERAFGAAQVGAVLLALGLVNLMPAPLAGLLERRLSPYAVALVAPLAQAALALVIFNTDQFGAYAFTTALCVVPTLFGHVFLFGLISRLDPSGRAPASTPAMIMLGSSLGPALGGALVQNYGYAGVAAASVVVALFGVSFAALTRRNASASLKMA